MNYLTEFIKDTDLKNAQFCADELCGSNAPDLSKLERGNSLVQRNKFLSDLGRNPNYRYLMYVLGYFGKFV